MNNRHLGEVQYPIAVLPHPVTQVHILGIKEIVLLKPSDLFQHCPAAEQERTDQPVYLFDRCATPETSASGSSLLSRPADKIPGIGPDESPQRKKAATGRLR